MTAEQRDAALRQLVADGLTFGECVSVFAESNDDDADYFIAKARDEIEVEGEIEIDDATIVSGSDSKGDYVLAWVWVPDDRTEDDEDDEEPSL